MSSRIHEKSNGINIISIEYSRKLRRNFKPIDVIYKPVKKLEKKVLCYFSEDISKSYRNNCGKGEKMSHGFAFECYYCGKFFARADKQKRHIESCSGIPGVVYNFNNENLVTFEDNLGSKGDLPMAIYFDYETHCSYKQLFRY